MEQIKYREYLLLIISWIIGGTLLSITLECVIDIDCEEEMTNTHLIILHTSLIFMVLPFVLDKIKYKEVIKKESYLTSHKTIKMSKKELEKWGILNEVYNKERTIIDSIKNRFSGEVDYRHFNTTQIFDIGLNLFEESVNVKDEINKYLKIRKHLEENLDVDIEKYKTLKKTMTYLHRVFIIDDI